MNRNTEFKGTFFNEYIDENGKIHATPVSFLMTVTITDGSFKGTREDEETKGLFSEPITVKGFIEGHSISFTVNYPKNYYSELETGKVVVINEKHPGVTYEGHYDKELGIYTGKYRVLVEEERVGFLQDDYIEEEIVGSWEMQEV